MSEITFPSNGESVETYGKTHGRELTGQITIDGMMYTQCSFRNATLRYGGGAPPFFSKCTFDEHCKMILTGSAVWTAVFFRHLREAGGGDITLTVGSPLNGWEDQKTFPKLGR